MKTKQYRLRSADGRYLVTITANDVPKDISVKAWSRKKGHLGVIIEGGSCVPYSVAGAEKIAHAILSVIARAKSAHRKIHGANP